VVLAVADGDHSVPPFRGLRDGQPPRLPIGANHNVLRESLPDFTIESTEITETDGKQTRVRTLAFQARPSSRQPCSRWLIAAHPWSQRHRPTCSKWVLAFHIFHIRTP
jgi:hypothetical protein